jgi:predicted deacylase
MINPTHIEAYSFFGLQKGPSVLILGGIHGDETCGSTAIKKINTLFSRKDMTILSGILTMIPTSNPLAASLNTRNGERNLNRNFYPKATPKDFEDYLNNILCPIISQHDIILDLHSFKIGKKPFALIKSIDKDHSIEAKISNRTMQLHEKTLASWLGVSTVVGNWTDTYERGVSKRKKRIGNIKDSLNSINLDNSYGMGTTEYSRENEAIAVTLECGQHLNPASVTKAFDAVLSVLAQLKMIGNEKAKLKINNINFVKLYEVFDKNAPNDDLLFSWKNFDPINKGTEIAIRADGEKVIASDDCCILFPNKNANPGQEWFYLAKNF